MLSLAANAFVDLACLVLKFQHMVQVAIVL